jgi:hypothetical protein
MPATPTPGLQQHPPATAVAPSDKQASTAAQLRDDLRPAPARIGHPDQPLSAPELELRNRLVRQRDAMRASRCPTCGNEPVEAQTRWQQRQDLATIWLHLDGDTIHEHRHCVACQPHDQPLIIECDRCGDGPLITGLPASTPIGQWAPALTRWPA